MSSKSYEESGYNLDLDLGTVTSHLSTQLALVQFVRTQLVGVYFRVSQIAITCVSLQLVGAYFRVLGSEIACVLLQCPRNQMESISIQKIELHSRVLTLFISMFSTSRISCSALKFKQKQRKHSMTRRNRLYHFRARSKWSA